MCVLCGEFISTFHWSDVDFRAQNVVNVGENATQRKRARLKRVSILNEILDFYGLKIADWQGSKFVLSDKKGQSVIVNDLGDLWGKANALCGRDLDALDEKLLAFLQANFLQKNEQNLSENLQKLKTQNKNSHQKQNKNSHQTQNQNLPHAKSENSQILSKNSHKFQTQNPQKNNA